MAENAIRNRADELEKNWNSLSDEDRQNMWKALTTSERHAFCVKNPVGLEFGVKLYHAICEKQTKEFPGLSGLLMYLDLTDEEYEGMLGFPEYEKWFIYAKRRRIKYLENLSLNDPKTAAACKLLLSQPENGGFGDKAPEKKPKAMTVTLRGIGEENGNGN